MASVAVRGHGSFRAPAAPSGVAALAALAFALNGHFEADEKDKMLIRVHIAHLRKKLADYGITIENVWGDGYRLTPTSLSEVRAAIAGAESE
jgi:hypothetical protein